MVELGQWRWQEPGTAWRGVGVYHVTLTVPSREPLFGRLVIPDGVPSKARIERTALGNAVVDELYVMCRHYPAIRILQFCLMPDHLHAVIHVTQVMDTSIRSVVRGYWQGVKKLGRAYTLAVSAELNSATTDEGNAATTHEGNAATTHEGTAATTHEGNAATTHEGNAATTDEGNAATTHEGNVAATHEGNVVTTHEGNVATAGEGTQGYPFPIFTERPFIRPLSRRGQLNTMIRYVQMNPQRLATKRLKPGYFRVQKDIEIDDRKYDGVGNVAILMGEGFDTVHVRSWMVKAAENGEDKQLRDYMNSRVLLARKGAVMVSPFISPQEKRVMQVLLQEQLPFILLTDNGFRDYYKPSDGLFDACAAGRLLILSPWAYEDGKRHISRSECVALNGIAEEICKNLDVREKQIRDFAGGVFCAK